MRLVPNERGAALITALMAVAVLALLAAGAGVLGAGTVKSTPYWTSHTAALYVAESGINDAVYRLDSLQQVPRQTYPANPPSFTSTSGLVDDQSSYQVWVQAAGDLYVLATARGRRSGVKRVVQVGIRLSRSCLFYDPDGDGVIEMSKNPPRQCEDIAVIVDCPNPPPGTGPGDKLWLKKKDETETIGPGAFAYTDVILGQDTSLTINGPASIYVSGQFRIGNDANLTINGPVTFYLKDDLEVLNDVTVQVNGTTNFYICDSVSFGNKSTLTSTAATTFYVANDFIVDNSTLAGSDPTLLTVFMSTTGGPKVELKNDSVFEGGIYAPTSDVTLKSKVELTGAVLGYTVDLRNNATVTYDPDVSSGGGFDTGIVTGTWGEK